MRFLILPFLMLIASCTAGGPKPDIVTIYQPVPANIPATLKRQCEKPYDASTMTTVGDMDERGRENEAKLLRCSAKVDRIIEWDAAN